MDNINVKKIEINDYLTKSNLPASDYVINPYVGCPHGCKYCYASFMKRFTGHKEEWGNFIDVKDCKNPINTRKIQNKNVFLSSVTDCYNYFEEEYKVTRNILKQLVGVDCDLGISTKSKLILRDLDLLKKMKNLKVSMSINTLDEDFRSDMDKASSIKERLDTLKELNKNGIYTVLFMSPIFPYITDGNHSFQVLYEQRRVLLKLILNIYKDIAWKSYFDINGNPVGNDNKFLVGLDTPLGPVGFVFNNNRFNELDVKVVSKAPLSNKEVRIRVFEKLASIKIRRVTNIINR